MKTRIAPSPTGYFHIGTLRTALLNYLKARANNGSFLLRIDDTDQSRNSEEYVDYIYSEMKRFNLVYDETFRQSDRLGRYLEVAVEIGKYKDDRFIYDDDGIEMTILRKDGYPTYNFASIVDDYDYDITDIIRGVDLINSLNIQKKLWVAVCNKFGTKEFPNVVHAGLLFDGKEKLAKRANNGNTSYYSNFKPEAILNWLFKLGWSHPDSDFDSKYKTLTLEQMISVFNEGKISQSNCKIDIQKLEWLNKKHQNDSN